MALVRSYFTKISRRLEKASRDPREAQAEALRRLVARGGGTVAGLRFGLARVRGTEDARRLPVTRYEDYRGLFESIFRFGRDADRTVGGSHLLAFGQTSGTTAEPKRYPVSADFLASYRRATMLMNASFFYSTGLWQDLFAGKRIALAARPEVDRSPSGLPVGFMSGIMTDRVPFFLRRPILPKPRVLKMAKWEDKIEAILEDARGEDIRMIGGIPPLVRNFTDRALEKYGIRTLAEAWPRLEVFLHGGVALSPTARAEFERRWGRRLIFWEMYAATEGQFGHTFHPEWPGMVFNPFENFYQFAIEGGAPAAAGGARGLLQLHELEAGKRYVVHVTTPGGLVNYCMGDVVEILSARPWTFRVCGREKEELSLTGEKITPDQLERAAELVRLGTSEFAVWVEEGNPNRLHWEIAGDVDSQVARRLDEALGEVNPTYREVRINDFIYGPPEAHGVPADWFAGYRARNLDRGQFKGKRLFRTREAFLREVAGPGEWQ